MVQTTCKTSDLRRGTWVNQISHVKVIICFSFVIVKCCATLQKGFISADCGGVPETPAAQVIQVTCLQRQRNVTFITILMWLNVRLTSEYHKKYSCRKRDYLSSWVVMSPVWSPASNRTSYLTDSVWAASVHYDATSDTHIQEQRHQNCSHFMTLNSHLGYLCAPFTTLQDHLCVHFVSLCGRFVYVVILCVNKQQTSSESETVASIQPPGLCGQGSSYTYKPNLSAHCVSMFSLICVMNMIWAWWRIRRKLNIWFYLPPFANIWSAL